MTNGCAFDTDGWCRLHQWDCADYALERAATGDVDQAPIGLTTEQLIAKYNLDGEGDV